MSSEADSLELDDETICCESSSISRSVSSRDSSLNDDIGSWMNLRWMIFGGGYKGSRYSHVQVNHATDFSPVLHDPPIVCLYLHHTRRLINFRCLHWVVFLLKKSLHVLRLDSQLKSHWHFVKHRISLTTIPVDPELRVRLIVDSWIGTPLPDTHVWIYRYIARYYCD